MRKYSLGLLALVLITTSALAHAEKWDFLGKHELGNMYLDLESVSRKGDTVSYWVKRKYFQVQDSLKNQFQYLEQRVKHEVNCKKHTVTFTEMQFFDDKGQKVAESGPMKVGPKPIEKDGFIIQETERLCPASGGKSAVLP